MNFLFEDIKVYYVVALVIKKLKMLKEGIRWVGGVGKQEKEYKIKIESSVRITRRLKMRKYLLASQEAEIDLCLPQLLETHLFSPNAKESPTY